MNKTANRSPAMDVIRCCALCSVAGVHFFLRTGFYETTMAGPRMVLMTWMRTALLVCVPLFLLLSGYLTGRSRPCRAYYGKLLRVLGIYGLASVLGFFFRRLYLGEEPGLRELIFGFLDYTGSQYGWYIEMYIGLFLLAPYLNILYEALGTREARRGLILTLLFLTALPGVLNIHELKELSWWLAPGTKTWAGDQLIPDWWMDLYPVTYYLLGAYLRDYPLKLRTGKTLALLLLTVTGYAGYCVWRSQGTVFVGGSWQYYGALPLVIESVLLFELLARLDYGWMGPKLRAFLAKVSVLSLGAYLVSWMFDIPVYTWLNAAIPDVRARLIFFPLTVPAVLIGSVLTAWVLEKLYDTLARLGKRKRT